MSRENVEVVQELLERFGQTHRAVRDLLAPGFIWDMSTFRDWPDTPEYHGPDAYDDFFEAWVEPYVEWSFATERVVDGGGNDVATVLRQRGVTAGSQAAVETQYGIVWTIQGGLITRGRCYATGAEALEAVGLSE